MDFMNVEAVYTSNLVKPDNSNRNDKYVDLFLNRFFKISLVYLVNLVELMIILKDQLTGRFY